MIYDLIIVGAGPAGLSSGIYAVERRLNTLILEGNRPGGQLVSLYPEKQVYDYPSFASIKGRDLAKRMVDHAQIIGCRIQVNYQVTAIEREKDGFQITTSQGEFRTKSVILASGIGLFAPRKLSVPGEDKLKDKGVFYQELPQQFRAKKGIFIGGGDTALELSLLLCPDGNISIVHRQSSFRALEANVEKINEKNIPIYFDSQVKEFIGDDTLKSVRIINNQTGMETIIPADFAVICIGVEIDPALIRSLDVEIKNQAVLVDESCQTSIPGLFAAGDVIVAAGKYKRITVAQGQAACAVQGVYMYLKKPYWAGTS